MDFTVTLLMSEFVTHDVRRLVVSRPEGFSFEPGQGVELAIATPGWKEQRRPFTPTSLNEDRVIEFTIKGYPEHNGVTAALHRLSPGATLIMSQPFGTIRYKGPGVFIAGGAGVTPFLAILRSLAAGEALAGQVMIFSNKTPDDIICQKELQHAFGDNLILTCTRSDTHGYSRRRIDKDFIAERITGLDRHFYVCGPPGFMEAVKGALEELGVEPDTVIFES